MITMIMTILIVKPICIAAIIMIIELSLQHLGHLVCLMIVVAASLLHWCQWWPKPAEFSWPSFFLFFSIFPIWLLLFRVFFSVSYFLRKIKENCAQNCIDTEWRRGQQLVLLPFDFLFIFFLFFFLFCVFWLLFCNFLQWKIKMEKEKQKEKENILKFAWVDSFIIPF